MMSGAKRTSKARLPRLRSDGERNGVHKPTRDGGNRTEWSCGATRVGALLRRVHLHLDTDRFLAALRRDAMWEAGCDYAVLALDRLASRLDRKTLATPLRSRAPAVPARAADLVLSPHVPTPHRELRRAEGTRKPRRRATSRQAARVTRAARAAAGASR